MRVAILGMGTIGSGVLNTIETNNDIITDYIGEPLEVTHIFSRTVRNIHDNDLTGIEQVTDVEKLKEIDVDIVIEVMGGMDTTYDILQSFLSRGIHVVSANKDMLASYVDDLSHVGNQNKAQLSYEASSAGGIPIINAIQYHLNANKLNRIMGILNGTTNYILTKMTNEGWDYEKALKEAQDIGFAEADPTNDVKGFDAQRKITLLSRLAYKRKIDVKEVPAQGIDEIDVKDIEIAKNTGYTIKLLGMSELEDDKLNISVAPALLPSNHQLAYVEEGMNAVYVNGNVIGEAMFYGPGAGSMETASAVVSDAMNIARFGYTGNFETDKTVEVSAEDSESKYYIRFADSQETAEQYLNEKDISFTTLQAGEDFTIQTRALSKEAVQEIQEALETAAVYEIVGDED